jgi:hypothetical protein
MLVMKTAGFDLSKEKDLDHDPDLSFYRSSESINFSVEIINKNTAKAKSKFIAYLKYKIEFL